ncbi:MAG: fructose-bisphosphate aldolase, class II [Parcubacteria group bacterium Gr01-1014_56]|nr:MAG: fructose-bisphosphate aldolase, class II [Parcubacteria group bacterium Gr01-1014_56]
MRTLRETITDFRAAGQAIGHFNFSDSNQLRAIAEAAKESGLPVIVGLSEGERGYFHLSHARALVDIYRREGVEIFLNADHTYSVEKVQRAISAGVDSVVVDGSKLPLEENALMLSACVKYARASGRDVVMEGELGYIGTSSKLLDALPEGVSPENLTTPEDAKHILDASGIDCLAPAVGNIHGMLKFAKEPRLHPERVKEIADAVGIPLVLHGASGNTEEEIRECIKVGVAIVHINTELRVAYRKGIEESFKNNPDEVAPYKFLTPAVESMKQFVAQKLRVFAGQ